MEEFYLKCITYATHFQRNVNQQKQPNTLIISIIILCMITGFPNQSDTYRGYTILLMYSANQDIVEFLRIKKNVLKIICYEYLKSL